MVSYLNLKFIAILLSLAIMSWEKMKVEPKVLHSKNTEVIPQIVYGSPAVAGQFPHQVVVIILDNTLRRIAFCGGSLIRNNMVLTAAHCASIAHGFELRFGGVILNQMDVTVTSFTFVIHPGWNPQTLANDLALIALQCPLTLTLNINPIAISEDFIPAGTHAIVTGFGKTSDASTSVSPILLYAEMKTISDENCGKFYGASNIISTMLCAVGHCEAGSCCCCKRRGGCKATRGNQAAKDSTCNLQNTCNGDSGGAIFVTDKTGYRKQIGVVSFGAARACEKGFPSGYTELFYFYRWIKDNIDCYSSTGHFCP